MPWGQGWNLAQTSSQQSHHRPSFLAFWCEGRGGEKLEFMSKTRKLWGRDWAKNYTALQHLIINETKCLKNNKAVSFCKIGPFKLFLNFYSAYLISYPDPFRFLMILIWHWKKETRIFQPRTQAVIPFWFLDGGRKLSFK